jgi:hypothetical protein
MGGNNTPSGNITAGDGSSRTTYPASTNLFLPHQPFDFYFYLSPNEHVFRDFDNKEALVWSEMSLTYGDWSSGANKDGSRVKSLTFPTPDALLRNQSYYLHAFIVKSGKSHIPRHPNYAGNEVVHGSFRLNKFRVCRINEKFIMFVLEEALQADPKSNYRQNRNE